MGLAIGLFLFLPQVALANNASFGYIFPRTICAISLPLLAMLWWFLRTRPESVRTSFRGKLLRLLLILQGTLLLVALVSGETLWYWERNDLGIRLSENDSTRYCVGLRRFLRFQEEKPVEDRALERELNAEEGAAIPSRVDGNDRAAFEEFQEMNSLTPVIPWSFLFIRPGMLTGWPGHRNCPAGGAITLGPAPGAARCSKHGAEPEVPYVAAPPEPWVERLHRALKGAFSTGMLSLVVWLALLIEALLVGFARPREGS